MIEFIRTAFHTARAYAWWAKLELETGVPLRRRKPDANSRHVLLIAWHLPPAISSGTYRLVSFLRYGPRFGWRLSAITGPINGPVSKAGNEQLRATPKSVKIHQFSTNTLRPGWRVFPRIMEDEFCNIFLMYSLSCKVLKDNFPWAIIASGPPFTSFVAGYFLARRFGAKLLLDYRDEWSENPFHFIPKGNSDKKWEKRCLRFADAIIFTTRSQLNHQLAINPKLSSERCYLVPNGWEPADFKKSRSVKWNESESSEDVLISYVGVLGRHTRPSNFLNSLQQVLSRREDLRRCIKLRFIGNISSAEREVVRDFRFQHVIETVDHVLKPVAAKMMRDSSALLILAEPELERYLPGKLYDYIAAGPSILVYGHRGEASELIERLSAGLFVPECDPDALERALDQLRGSSNTVSNRSEEIREWLERHTREKLAGDFFQILEELAPIDRDVRRI